MAESTAQEKTEKATPKKQRDARKKGQIPRSRDLASLVLLVSSSGLLYLFGPILYQHMFQILIHGFMLPRDQIMDVHQIIDKAEQLTADMFLLFSPFFALSVISVYFGNILLGGHVIAFERLRPVFSNINPAKGFKKFFSFSSFLTLFQSMLKVTLIGVITALIIHEMHVRFLLLSVAKPKEAMHEVGHDLSLTFLLLSVGIVIIALIDIALQIYQNQKQLRMTRQEVKDEAKQTEIPMEIKRKVRQLQRQAASSRRMLQDVPKASVVITNPTEFAVAVAYDHKGDAAPIILAMGAGFMALSIRRTGTEHCIPVLHIPLLARALYYHGEIGQEIPEALFHVVARVLAYILQLDNPLNFHLDNEWIDALPIPEELIRPQGRQHGTE